MIKRWVLVWQPSPNPKSFEGHDCGDFDSALQRVMGENGEWKSGYTIELSYEGVREMAGTKHSTFVEATKRVHADGKKVAELRAKYQEAAKGAPAP